MHARAALWCPTAFTGVPPDGGGSCGTWPTRVENVFALIASELH